MIFVTHLMARQLSNLLDPASPEIAPQNELVVCEPVRRHKLPVMHRPLNGADLVKEEGTGQGDKGYVERDAG